MLTRRNFLKGLLSTAATGALVKNGIVQPDQAIAESERRVFDMAQNTWRENTHHVTFTKSEEVFRYEWGARDQYLADMGGYLIPMTDRIRDELDRLSRGEVLRSEWQLVVPIAQAEPVTLQFDWRWG